MSRKLALLLSCGVILLWAAALPLYGQEEAATSSSTSASQTSRVIDRGNRRLLVHVLTPRGVNRQLAAMAAQTNAAAGEASTSTASSSLQVEATDASDSIGRTLPLWTFRVEASRDGNKYSGAMVGRNPFTNPGPTNVPTNVIPLIIQTKNIGSAINFKTGVITTQPGDNTFDPTVPDTSCFNLRAPNNVPATLVKQSPIFTPTDFVFGGTHVGKTQYTDAFQRANFWNVLGEDRDDYHVRMNPVRFLEPIVLDVPDVYGLAFTNGLLFGPPAFCTPFGIIDINWFDTYLTGTVIPDLTEKGIVDPTNFPIFLVYNVVWASPVTNIGTCCILGYHSATGFPIPTQTYSPSEFDTSGFFTADASPLDTEILAHEVGEWINDPEVSNPTPPWGHTGQVGGCQANLEVGDPLSGTDVAPVTMPNGFTYHLQELAFFSWFFGAPSVGIHGWFSNNGTFLKDAGAPCH